MGMIITNQKEDCVYELGKEVFGEDEPEDAEAIEVAELLKEANAKANSLPGGRTALKAVTMLHRKPAVSAAMKRLAAKKSLAADGLGMTHVESEGFGKVRMFRNAIRSYIQMWNEDASSWKPCLFSNQGHQHQLKTEYVWWRLLAEKHTAASIDSFKASFASGGLSVVNGHVVKVKAEGGNDSESDYLGGVSTSNDTDVD